MTFNGNGNTRTPKPMDTGARDQSNQSDATNGSRSTDHSLRVVEAPLYSPRWARFFTVAALAALSLAIWVNFIAPYLLVKRAEEMCKQERDLRSGQPFPQMMTADGACFRMLEIQNQNSLSNRVQGFVGFLSFPIGLFYLARRLKSQSALETVRGDRRPPVLYLRSFRFDAIDDLQAQRSGQTEEAAMVSGLERIGPVLAIGRPGERLGHLGAARLYVADDDWQTIARRLMASARLVVIRAGGDSPGIRWELACARDGLPAEKVVLWFPSKFNRATYAGLRDVAHEALKVDLPEACPKGYVTFDADWQTKPAKPEIDVSDELPARPEAMDLSRDVGEPPSTENSSASVGLSLSEMLEQLDVKTTSPPPFRLHHVVWVGVGLWLVLLWSIPGERWSFGLEAFLDLPHFVGTLVEGATAMLLAVGLAFIPYIRNPAGRLLPSLMLCAVLALDGYWIVARAAPNEAKPTHPVTSHEALLVSSTQLCRKVVACLPQPEIEERLAECIDSQIRLASHDGARGIIVQLQREGLEKCTALECEDFAVCYAREVGLLSLPLDEKHRLFQLVCEALWEEESRTLETEEDGPKLMELYKALEELQNPPLAAAIVQEGKAMCASEERVKPGGSQ